MDDTDRCPSCGGRMQPVLQREDPLDTGPLLADSPVLLVCPACTPGDLSGAH